MLASGRVEVGDINYTKLTLSEGIRTYEEWDSNRIVTGVPHKVKISGTGEFTFHALDTVLKEEYKADYNQKLRKLNEFIDAYLQKFAKK